jgi:hypothetical protein
MPLTIPATDDAAALADWAELRVLTVDVDGLSIARLVELLRGEGTDLAEEELALDVEEEWPGDETELALVDQGRGERDLMIEQLLDEIAVRLRLGPTLYAFERQEERLIRREAAGADVYVFLLVISSKEAAFRTERRAHEIEAIFDGIALEALRRYLGRGAIGVRFAKGAYDPDDGSTRPKRFREAIEWLRGQLRLARGHQQPPDEERDEHWEDDPNLAHPPLNSYKDAGVDVVVWWRFSDGRAGSPVMLAQCTVQLEWGEKVRDIDVKLWEKWIDFETVPPQTALVVPFAVSRTLEQWTNRTVTAGVIIDRLRLLELLTEIPEDDLGAMVDAGSRAWVDRELLSLT